MTRSACGVPLRPLDAGVDVLGVLAEDDDVHHLGLLHRRRRPVEVADRAHAGVEVEHLAQRDVEAADAAADRRRQRPLDRDLVRAAPPRACRSGSHSPCLVLRLLARRAPRTTRSSACRRRPSRRRASKTRTLARQMSGPVPSPSMKGMIGSSGTTSRPLLRVMAVPVVGAFRIEKFGIRSRPRFGVTGSSQKLWKSLWKTPVVSPFAPHQIGGFMRFAPRWCVAGRPTNAHIII